MFQDEKLTLNHIGYKYISQLSSSILNLINLVQTEKFVNGKFTSRDQMFHPLTESIQELLIDYKFSPRSIKSIVNVPFSEYLSFRSNDLSSSQFHVSYISKIHYLFNTVISQLKEENLLSLKFILYQFHIRTVFMNLAISTMLITKYYLKELFKTAEL